MWCLRFYSPGNVFKVTIYIQASKYIHCLQVPNSQHCRENGTGIGVSGIGVGQEKLGKNFLAFTLGRKIITVLFEQMKNSLSIRNKIPFQQPYWLPFSNYWSFSPFWFIQWYGSQLGKNTVCSRKMSCSIKFSYWT